MGGLFIPYSLSGIEDKIIRTICDDKSGTVCLVEHAGVEYVRKEIKLKNIRKEKMDEKIKMLDELKDQHILMLQDYWYSESTKTYKLYTEYCRKGTLLDIIKNKKNTFSKEEMLNYMNNIISVLKYLHYKGIFYKNLNPGDIMVEDHNELLLSVIDLIIKDDNDNESNLSKNLNYMAPELFGTNRVECSESSDIFSVGCILYEIYTLHKAYEENDLINKSNKELSFKRMYDEKIDKIEELIKRMLERDVKKRIEMEEIEEEIKRINNFSIISFYVGKGEVNCRRLHEISEMNSVEFQDYWKTKLLEILFPPLNEEDAKELKSQLNKFKDDLHKLIELCYNRRHHVDNCIIKFLNSIGDIEYINDLRKIQEQFYYEDVYNEGMKRVVYKEYEKSLKYYMCALNNTCRFKEMIKGLYRISVCFLHLIYIYICLLFLKK